MEQTIAKGRHRVQNTTKYVCWNILEYFEAHLIFMLFISVFTRASKNMCKDPFA